MDCEPPISYDRDEICRSTSVPLTPVRWKFMGMPRKVSDGAVQYVYVCVHMCVCVYGEVVALFRPDIVWPLQKLL